MFTANAPALVVPNDSSSRPDWLLLEDGPLLAINKPFGILTEGIGDKYPSMVGLVKDYLRTTYHKPGNVYLGIPHRLDRASTGVLVMTRNSKAAARVAEQFEQRTVRKIYWAILEQPPSEPQGELVDWLLKEATEARSVVVPAGTPNAKEARLRFQILDRPEFKSLGTLVEVELLTGRMHQIRVQFAARHCPIVGDTKYGARARCDSVATSADTSESLVTEDQWIALHSRQLCLKHPIRYDEVVIDAPPPEFWSSLARR